MDWLKSIDVILFNLINQNGFIEIDYIMQLISNKLVWIPLYLYLVYIIYKNFKNEFFKILSSLIILIFLSDYGSVNLFKEIFQRLRPCYALDYVRLVGECGGQYGFISSHAANSFALAFYIGLLFKRFNLFAILFSWAVIIGYSRVYLGVHYPFDVLSGMLWGLFVSLLTYFIYIKKMKNIDWVWILWVILVCIWNFGWPQVPAIADVIVAIILSFIVLLLKNFIKKRSQ